MRHPTDVDILCYIDDNLGGAQWVAELVGGAGFVAYDLLRAGTLAWIEQARARIRGDLLNEGGIALDDDQSGPVVMRVKPGECRTFDFTPDPTRMGIPKCALDLRHGGWWGQRIGKDAALRVTSSGQRAAVRALWP